MAGTPTEGALVRGLAIRHDQRTPTPSALLDELNGIQPRRKYRSEEAVEIVKRAAALEASNPTSTGAMTLSGVEALGADVGISAELVRAAAAREGPGGRSALGTPAPTPASNVLAGGPTRITFERIVQGELPSEEFVTVVEEIRRMIGNAGSVNQLGRSFTWTIGRMSVRRDLEVSVSVRAGTTRIGVYENLSQLVGVVYGPIGGGMGGGGFGVLSGILAGAFHNPLAVIAALPVWAAITYLTARTVYARTSNRRLRELEALADRVAAVVQEIVAPPHRLPGSS
jgi:hypothetical protein